MLHAPIYGSQFRPPAKVYKRLTNDMPIKIEHDKIVQIEFNCKTVKVADDGVITVQSNTYVCVGALRWTEAAEKQTDEYQPIDGLMMQSGYMTIKYNGTYKLDSKDLSEPQVGDLLVIDGELWIVESPIQRVRHRNLRNMATVYLQLTRTGTL